MEGNFHYLVIGALVASGASIVAIITFWMKLGGRLASGESAMALANILVGKIELIRADFNDYKVEAAKDFVTSKELAHAENRMSDSVDSMRGEVREMNLRLDRLIEGILKNN